MHIRKFSFGLIYSSVQQSITKLICSSVVNNEINLFQCCQSRYFSRLWCSIPGNGNGNENSIKFHSHFREREWEWKIPFPFSGTGLGVENSIPDFRDGNWRPIFPGIPGIGNSRSWLLPGAQRPQGIDSITWVTPLQLGTFASGAFCSGDQIWN